MYRRRWLSVLIGLASLTGTANAQVEQDGDTVANRYLAAMQRKGYAFLTEDALLRRRDQVAAFVGQHLRRPLDEPIRAAMLDGIDGCIDRLYAQPAGKVDYGNGFGSGGEEWMYLNDRDYFLTFQYHLWVSLTGPAPTPADVQRRETQRQWMRQYLTDLPNRGDREPTPHEGIRSDEVRGWALAELEKAFADPLHLLSVAMPDDGFVKLQNRFKQFSNGIAADFHAMEVAALASRFTSEKDPAARYGYEYPGQLPFTDTVVSLWGNGPSLCFASNADFRGHHGVLSPSIVYDVIRCVEMRAGTRPVRAGTATEAWLAKEGRGELTVDGPVLRAVRGARIAKLPVKNWFEADKLSEVQLQTVLRQEGGDQISISGLPTRNGPHRGDRSEGEFFVVVQSRERRLAVINLHNYEFQQVMFWCRPRTTDPDR